MKKLLGTTLALAMIAPAGANAELLKNLKLGGQLDVQTTSARNVTDFLTRQDPSGTGATNNDRLGHAGTRVLLKMDWDLLDDVHAHVTLVKGASNHSTRVYGAAAQDLNTIQSATFVEEANVKIDKVLGLVDLTAGRQFYGEEGDLVIYYGPRDNYGLTVSALDIFRADWKGEHMSVTAIAGKITDTTVGATGNAASDLRGLTVSCNRHENVKPSLYLYNMVTHRVGALGAAAGKNTVLWVAGLKTKLTWENLWGSLEFAKNFGEDRTTFSGLTIGPNVGSFTGWALQAKTGYKYDWTDHAMFHPWAEFGLGTGDSNFGYAGNANFQSIATDYRPGGIYGRFDTGSSIGAGSGINTAIASNGLTNRVIWGVGVKATPAMWNKLTTGVQFYRYAFHRVAPNSSGYKTSRNIGSEVDLTGEWKHSENVSFKGTIGSFRPGAYVADTRGANAAINPAVMLAGDVSIKF